MVCCILCVFVSVSSALCSEDRLRVLTPSLTHTPPTAIPPHSLVTPCSVLPPPLPDQVPVLQLLGHIWCTLLQMDTTTVAAAVGAAAGASYGGSADTSSSSQQHPVPAAALPGMLSYLSGVWKMLVDVLLVSLPACLVLMLSACVSGLSLVSLIRACLCAPVRCTDPFYTLLVPPPSHNTPPRRTLLHTPLHTHPYIHTAALSSLNPAVKLEAARVILRVSRLARRGPAGSSVQGSSGSGGGVGGATANSGSSSSSQAVGRLRLVGEVPPSTAAAAIEVRLCVVCVGCVWLSWSLLIRSCAHRGVASCGMLASSPTALPPPPSPSRPCWSSRGGCLWRQHLRRRSAWWQHTWTYCRYLLRVCVCVWCSRV